MPNGKPAVPDIEVLTMFEEPFIVNDIPRDERFALKFNLPIQTFYMILNKKRFIPWIEYGITLRSGWLTESGKAELQRLRQV